MRARVKRIGHADVRLGPWQSVLVDTEADSLVSDPPYSEKTRKGHDAGDEMVRDGVERRMMSYAAWTEDHVAEFVRHWSPRTRGWFTVFTDDILAPVYKRLLAEQGRLVFPMLPYVEKGMTVRRQGDGHSSWTTFIIAARPRTKEFARWGTLQGAYILPPGHKERRRIIGQKTLWVMSEVVRDHSRVGDLVVDPCCGSGSTLVAAVRLGRNALGADRDGHAVDIANERLLNEGCGYGGRRAVRSEMDGGRRAHRPALGDLGSAG